jgi:ABC-type dipeptide/oligopeptide/nickel transport system permease component
VRLISYITLRLILIGIQIIGLVFLMYMGLMIMEYSPGQKFGFGGLDVVNSMNARYGFGSDFIEREDNFQKYYEQFQLFWEKLLIGECSDLGTYVTANLNGTGCSRTFGISWQTHSESTGVIVFDMQQFDDVLRIRVFNTLLLFIIAFLLYSILGTFLGIIAGVYPHGFFDMFLRIFTSIGTAIPAILLMVYIQRWLIAQRLLGDGIDEINEINLINPYNYIMYLQSSIVKGMSLDTSYQDFHQHLLLFIFVIISLVIISISFLFRLVRTLIINEMKQPYIRTAVSKGLKKQNLVVKHALPNALPNIINAIALTVPMSITATAIVEFVFGYQGIASLMVLAAPETNFPVIISGAIFLITFSSFMMLLSDIIIQIIDPRRRK